MSGTAPANPALAASRLYFGSLQKEEEARQARGGGAAAASAGPAAAQVPGAVVISTATGASKLDAAVQLGIAAGHINIGSSSITETLELSESSQMENKKHEDLMRAVEGKRRARTVTVPTSDPAVRRRLRELSEPITLFGEQAPQRRERLREVLAMHAVASATTDSEKKEVLDSVKAATKEEADFAEGGSKASGPFAVPGSELLKKRRLEILNYSLPRAAARIAAQKVKAERSESVEQLNARHGAMVSRLSKFHNYYSEIGDVRPLAAAAFAPNSKHIAISSWSGSTKVWDVVNGKHVLSLDTNDRVSDVAYNPLSGLGTLPASGANIATCSAGDLIHLWSAPIGDSSASSSSSAAAAMSDSSTSSAASASVPSVRPLATLRGHADRCARVAFHPSGRFLGSTSFDATWRLWDIETSAELLIQGGHSKGVYGIAFQCDGSLVCTGDAGGIGRVWDLRTGKAVLPLEGHAKQILCIDFSPNGYHVATGSEDHSIRIWDLRARKSLYTIPGHASLISSVRFQPQHSEFIVSASFDNSAKIWSATDFSLIKTLAGHENKVVRAEISPDSKSIATASHDRTWKLWRTDEDDSAPASTNDSTAASGTSSAAVAADGGAAMKDDTSTAST